MAHVPTSYPLPRKHLQNEGFLVFSGGLNVNIGHKWVNVSEIELETEHFIKQFFIVILVFLQKVNFYGSKISKYWQQITNV